MDGVDKFRQLIAYAEANCEPFASTTPALYLHVLNWSSLLIVFALYVYGARRRELWATLLGLGLTLDWLFNAALRALIRHARPLSACGNGYGMPAFESEHAAFLAISLVVLFAQRTTTSAAVYVVFLVAYVASINAMLVYFNYATSAQTLAGSALGTMLGGAWQLFVFGTLRWYFDAIIERSSSIYPVVDTVCLSSDPIDGDPPPLVRLV